MNFWRRDMRNQARKWQKIVMLVFIIIIFVLVYFYSKYQNFAWNTKISETREITIEKWDNFSTLWVKIPEFNNIFYKLYIRNNPPDFNLIEGKYQLKEWQNVLETFESLKKPVPGSQNITILEWWNIYDIDKTLESKGLIKAWEFVSYAKNKEKIKALSDFFSFLKNDKLTSLEWYLYPDTYRIDTANFKINNFTVMLLENFEKKVYKKLFEGKYSNQTTYDVINLASIVEKEESITENKPTVAWILKKRLNANWKIWADATVCYAHELPTQECTPKKVNEYVYEKNDFNTRMITWLPKTPIWNPSLETIEATLNDKKTEYWYYLHNLSGKIFYAKTDAEHEANKKNYMNKK